LPGSRRRSADGAGRHPVSRAAAAVAALTSAPQSASGVPDADCVSEGGRVDICPLRINGQLGGTRRFDAVFAKCFGSDRAGANRALVGTLPGATFLFWQVRAMDHTLNPNRPDREAITSIVTGQRIGAWLPRLVRLAMARGDGGHTVDLTAVYPLVLARFTGDEGWRYAG
jgi:hypothetical protein